MSDINYREIEVLPVDFEEMVLLLKNRIQTRLPNRWTDFLTSNFGMELLEAFAYEATLFHYYLNASVNECFMPTAKTQTAVYNLAKTIGYKPLGPQQSTVSVRFSIPAVITKNIDIPIYTKLNSSSGIPFYTTENAVLYKNTTYVDVDAKAGSLFDETFISTGEAKYKYVLKNYPVNAVESVFVDDQEYTYSSFMDLETTDLLYTIEFDSDYKASIIFGDGKYGSNPSKGSIINIKYVSGADSTSNVSPFTVNSILDILYDEDSAIVTNVSVVNNEPAVGGSEAETPGEIKVNAPSIYRTQYRCVTKQDFKDTVLALAGVEKTSVIDHTDMDEIGIFGVKICVVPEGGEYPTETFKNYIQDYLEQKKIISTQVDIIDPSFIPYDVSVSVNLQGNVSSSIVSNRIRSIVTEYLKWENRELGEEVSKQEIYKLISNISGVGTINNLTVEENRSVYVSETPVIGENTVKYHDSLNMIRAGAQIQILDINNELALTTTVVSINESFSEMIIEDSITQEMNIGYGSLIYPMLTTNQDHNYGEKEVKFQIDISLETSQVTYSLINFTNTTIYFSDSPNKYYRVLFKIGDSLYLNEPVDRFIPSGTNIIILNKKYTPVLAANTSEQGTVLNFKDYPRFAAGSSLTRTALITFAPDTLNMIRSNSTDDYLNSVINTNYLASVSKVYLNNNNIFVEGTDYNLLDNGKTISWTVAGRLKITPNTRYYVDIVKKIVNTTPSDIVYYVKSINKKSAVISPPTPVKLLADTVFEYTTEVYKLLPNEIADVGNISVVIN